MKPIFCALALLGLAVSGTSKGFAWELDEQTIAKASQLSLLAMPEPPLGYSISKHPIVVDKKLVGFQVQVMKEGAVSKVLIKVETRDLSERRLRVVACKGYVNGLASGLKEVGFNVTESTVPDLQTEDFKKPVVVELALANKDGSEILIRKRMFFTKKGYDVSVIATNKADLDLLSKWAEQVKPAETP